MKLDEAVVLATISDAPAGSGNGAGSSDVVVKKATGQLVVEVVAPTTAPVGQVAELVSAVAAPPSEHIDTREATRPV